MRAVLAAALLVFLGCTANEPREMGEAAAAPGTATPDADPAKLFLGFADDAEHKIADGALAGITDVTKVQDAAYARYLELKKKDELKAEERRGEFVYFAVEDMRCVPFSSSGPDEPVSAMVVITERYKARIPKK